MQVIVTFCSKYAVISVVYVLHKLVLSALRQAMLGFLLFHIPFTSSSHNFMGFNSKITLSAGCVCIGGALVVRPGMLFPNSRGIKDAANLRLLVSYLILCQSINLLTMTPPVY